MKFGGKPTIFGNIHVVIQIWKLGNVNKNWLLAPWNLAIPKGDFEFIFQPSIFRGYVSFREGTVPFFWNSFIEKFRNNIKQQPIRKNEKRRRFTTRRPRWYVCLTSIPTELVIESNPFEKYARQIGSFPQFSEVKNKKYSSCHHHPATNSPGEMGIRRVFVL